jgi:hypothetical protein
VATFNLNEWLQDALTDFIRNWVYSEVQREHPEAAETHVHTSVDASPSAVKVYWFFRPNRMDPLVKIEGEKWYTPRDVLELYLEHGESAQDV